MKDTFTYDDADGSFEIEVEEEGCRFSYSSNGDLNNLRLEHCPHDLEDFFNFLFAAARSCQAEFGRQELERLEL